MAADDPKASGTRDALASVYSQVCDNHRAIADFRAKLLALLPTVSGAAIFVLLSRDNSSEEESFAAIGLFGFAVTFGLFMYDLRGIQDCVELRRRAPEIEAELGVKRAELSVFRDWPSARFHQLADEVGASWIVYTAVLGSWLFLAGKGSGIPELVWGIALVVLYVGLLIWFVKSLGPRIRSGGQDPGGAAGARTWEHSALAVTDLQKAVSFYEQAFGYEVLVQPELSEKELSEKMARMVGADSLTCHLAQLKSPISQHVLELVQFCEVLPEAEERAPTRPGAGHLSFVVGDLDTAVANVERLGGCPVGEITLFPDGRRVYCRDGSGTTIELAELK